MLINPYRFSSLLLDLNPGAACAYSLRQLKNDAVNVVRVRRSSDNAEQDFTAAQVSSGALTTFCGAGNGFVRTWYDQSENGAHATQASSSNQPQLVSNGSLLIKNSKPCISFGSDAFLSVNISFTGYTLFSVFDPRAYEAGFCIFWNALGANAGAGVRPTLKLYDAVYLFNANAANNTISTNEQCVFVSVSANNANSIYKNATLLATATGTPVARTGFNIGTPLSTNNNSSGVAELVFYVSDQSANRVNIVSNINTHYTIF